jgi:hypothetical protein
VKLPARPIFVATFLLLATPVILLIALNLYLLSPQIQEKIRSELSTALGTPISIQSLHLTPTGGLKLKGILAGSDQSNPILTADSLTIYPKYLPLLKGQFSIKGLVLNHPIIRLPLSSSSLLIPLSSSSLSGDVVASENQSQLTTGSSISTPASTAASNTIFSGWKFENILISLPYLKIVDADVTLLNSDSSPLAAMHEMKLHGKLGHDGIWNGNFEAGQATIGTALILHEIHSPIRLSPDSKTLFLDELKAVLGGGDLQGKFSLDLPPATPKYHTELSLTGALLNQFFADASLGTAASEGNVSGDLQLSGITGTGTSMEGNGHLLCTDAVIEPADFLKQIGQLLQVDELQLLRISEGHASFAINDGKMTFDDLTLHSENLALTARGPILLNGDLDLNARLLFNEKMSERLHGLLGSQMSAAPEAGYSQISFHVAGPIKHPSTDLLERLTGIHFGGDLGGLLQGIFGHH